MPRALDHRIIVGVTVGIVIAYKESTRGENSDWPFLGGAALCARLPDIVEPAHHPNHTQLALRCSARLPRLSHVQVEPG